MEENIKTLENLASRTYKIDKDGWETAVCSIDEQLAIRNIIARNKELEKQMGKDLDVVYLQGVYNERDRWKSKVRELYNHYKDTGYYELESVLQELLEERN